MANLLAVVIPTRNDYGRLSAQLPIVSRYFSLVYVIDSSDCPETRQLCCSHDVNYLVFTYQPPYPKKRNWFLDTFNVPVEWILFLDSDEIPRPELSTLLSLLLPSTPHDAFLLKYSDYFMGRMLKYGDGMRKIALFRTGQSIRYERINHSSQCSFDMEIHEHPVGYRSIGHLPSLIDHYGYLSLSHYLAKHNEYSTYESEKLYHHAQSSKSSHGTIRHSLKYRLLITPMFPFLYFLYSYILRLGFLDFFQGFVVAILKSYYFFSVQLKYRELRYSSGMSRSPFS